VSGGDRPTGADRPPDAAGTSGDRLPPAHVVTVSASYGAGGSVVAPLLAARLGLPFADRLILPRGTTSDPASERLTDGERDQQGRSRLFRRLAQITGGLNLPVPTSEDFSVQIREQVETSVRDLAATTGAVILGRAGAVVLAGNRWAFHVRLDGPPSRRVTRACIIERISTETAHDRLVETDRARARFLSRIYGREPTDSTLYHLILDSTAVSLDDCVEVLAAAATAFWAEAERADAVAGPRDADDPER
jgi:cytidylate kinase